MPDLSTLSTLSTGQTTGFGFARIDSGGHVGISRSRKAARKRDGLPRCRQCREGRYPSGRRPGTLWWGSREEARGSGETLSRTHFSGVRRDLSLRAMETQKAAWRACSKGDRTGLEGFARRETDGREAGFARWERAANGWSPACRKDVRRMVAGSPERRPTGGDGACSVKV